MIACAASPWLADRLSGRLRVAPVLARGTHAVYVDDGGVAVAVLAGSAVAVPVGLRTQAAQLPADATDPADTAVVGEDGIRLGARTFSVARVVTAVVPRLPGLFEVGRVVADWLVPGTDRRLDAARAQLPADALRLLGCAEPAAVARLLGRGDGLTPLGDDVLAGWLVTRYAADRDGEPVATHVERAKERTTTLSATLLDRAAAGEGVPQLRDLLVGIGSGAAPAGVRARLEDLLAVGHSSGAGYALGVALALAAGAGRVRP